MATKAPNSEQFSSSPFGSSLDTDPNSKLLIRILDIFEVDCPQDVYGQYAADLSGVTVGPRLGYAWERVFPDECGQHSVREDQNETGGFIEEVNGVEIRTRPAFERNQKVVLVGEVYEATRAFYSDRHQMEIHFNAGSGSGASSSGGGSGGAGTPVEVLTGIECVDGEIVATTTTIYR